MGQGQDSTLSGGGRGQRGSGTLEDMLKQYNSGFGDLTKAYLSKQGKGLIDAPSFQEMYNSYRQVGEQETQRQSAALNESFGSQGARYGSDVLRSQNNLRQEFGSKLLDKAGNLQLGLRQQQANEYVPFLESETNQRANALSYLNQDFLRRTSPPPLLSPATTYAGGFGPPNTVVI